MLNSKEKLRRVIKIAGTSYISLPKDIIKRYKINKLVSIDEKKDHIVLRAV